MTQGAQHVDCFIEYLISDIKKPWKNHTVDFCQYFPKKQQITKNKIIITVNK